MKKLSHTDRVNLLLSTQTTYKHLRGRHDQRDHAWNRGMGRGGTGSSAASSHPKKAKVSAEQHRADIVSLQKKVDAGEMTYHDMQNKLRDNRGYPPLPPRTRKQMVQDGKGLAQAQANVRPLTGVDIAGQAAGSTLANRGPQSIISGLTERLTGFIDRLRNPSAPRVSPQMKKYTKDLQQTFVGKSYGETMDLIKAITREENKHPLYPKNFDEVEALVSYYQPKTFPAGTPYEGDYVKTDLTAGSIRGVITNMQKKNPETNPRLMNVNGNIYYTGDLWVALENLAALPKYQQNSTESFLINPFNKQSIEWAIRGNKSHTSEVIDIGGIKFFDNPNTLEYLEWAWMANYFGEDVVFQLTNDVKKTNNPYYYGKIGQKPKWFIDNAVPDNLDNFGRIDDFQLYNTEVIPPYVQSLFENTGTELQSYLLTSHPPGSPLANTLQTLLGLDVQNPDHMNMLSSLLSFSRIPGTNAQIDIGDANGTIVAEITSTNPDTGERIKTKRRIYKASNGVLEIFNDGLQVKGIKGAGIGHALLARQVLAARQIGLQTNTTVDIKTDAMSATPLGDRPQQNGLHTWPRVGYDVMIPPEIKKVFGEMGFDVSKTKRTSELFLMQNIDGKLAVELWPSVVEQVMQQNGSINAEGVIRATDIRNTGLQSLLSYSQQKLIQKKLFSGEERPKTAAQTAAQNAIQALKQTLTPFESRSREVAETLIALESAISSPISQNSDYEGFVTALIRAVSSDEPVEMVFGADISSAIGAGEKIPLVSFRGSHISPQPSTSQNPIEIDSPFIVANAEELLQTWNSFSQTYGINDWRLDESIVSPELISAIESQLSNDREIMSTVVNALQMRENNNITLQSIQKLYSKLMEGYAKADFGSPLKESLKRITDTLKTEFSKIYNRNAEQTSAIENELKKVDAYVTGSSVNVTPEVTAFYDATLGTAVNPDMQKASFSAEIFPENDTVSESELEQHREVVRQIAQFMENYVDKRLHPKLRLQAAASPEAANWFSEIFIDTPNVASVGSMMSSVANTMHEFFHGMESQYPEVKKLVNAFWASRLQGETLAYRQRGVSWMPDKFGDWYIGMSNVNAQGVPTGESLEVLSMAASFFITDPVRFAREQPDYYRFIATLLSGKWMDE
jgi:hypothetical protein